MAKKKILVVDDEKDLVEMISLRLEASDFMVIKAYDGQAGLELARTKKPDLIILDLMLPKIDGYKVCRMLKFDVKHKDIPVILFTAKALDTDKELGKQVRADAYVTKPFEAEILLMKINQLLK